MSRRSGRGYQVPLRSPSTPKIVVKKPENPKPTPKKPEQPERPPKECDKHSKPECPPKECDKPSKPECPPKECGALSRTLFYRDFKKNPFTVGPSTSEGTDFLYLSTSDPEVVTNDGIATRDSNGLLITSEPYQHRGISIFDHTKYLAYTRETFPVPGIGVDAKCPQDVEIYYEARIAFEPTGLDSPGLEKYYEGISDLQNDIRLSCGAMNLMDLSTGMVFDFMIGNRTLYALYEHLPISSDTDIFTSAKAVATINPAEELNLRIGYNAFRKTVTWYLEGNPVHQITRPGMPLYDRSLLMTNGEAHDPKEVFSNSLVAGFGLFTLLDFFPADESYPEVGQEYTLKAGETLIQRVKVLADLQGVYHRKLPNFSGDKVPLSPEEFIYSGSPFNPDGTPVVDGQGGLLRVRTVEVGTRRL